MLFSELSRTSSTSETPESKSRSRSAPGLKFARRASSLGAKSLNFDSASYSARKVPAWQGRKPESDFRVRARIGGEALLVEGAAFTSNLKIRGDLPEAPSVATYPGVVYPWRRPPTEIKLEHES